MLLLELSRISCRQEHREMFPSVPNERFHPPPPPTFSVISWEWCKECSLSWNILCCSELARRHVSQVHKVQEVIPGKSEISWRKEGEIFDQDEERL